MPYVNCFAHLSDDTQIGGRQKMKPSRHKRDEYSRVDPTRDKERDKKRKFGGQREFKRSSYEE